VVNPWTPVKVKLARSGAAATNKVTEESYVDNPNLRIKEAKDRRDTSVATKLVLRLQTLDQPQGYWLDTGILLGS